MAQKEKSRRQLQVGETIKRAVSDIFSRENILTLPGTYVTVLEADASPDMKNVRIHIDIFGNEKLHGKIIKQLNKAAPYFRAQVAKKANLRFVPLIAFELDTTQSKAIAIEGILEAERKKQELINKDES